MSRVLIVMGSDSDAGAARPAWEVLGELGIDYDVRVASAHRTPERVYELATGARQAGFGVVIAAAGAAAHLAGVFAAHTTLPVVALPLGVGSVGGVDALLSSVQMPPGVPLAAVGIGGARNAGLYAAAILGVTDQAVAAALDRFRASMRERVREADEKLRSELTAKR